ncbi:unnamed protein product [Arabidopsis halleri]
MGLKMSNNVLLLSLFLLLLCLFSEIGGSETTHRKIDPPTAASSNVIFKRARNLEPSKNFHVVLCMSKLLINLFSFLFSPLLINFIISCCHNKC